MSYIGLFICLLGLQACGKTTHSFRIPKDTPIVGKMNSLRVILKIRHAKKSLAQELDNIIMRNIAGIKLFDELRGAGINFINVYLFGDLSPQNPRGYFAFTLALQNAKKFQDFLNVFKLQDEMQVGNSYQFIERERAILAWNSKELVFIASDSTSNKELKKQLNYIMNLSPAESLPMQNKNFVQFQRHKADLGLWLNIQSLANENPIGQLVSNLNLKDNYLHALADFGHGNIKIETDYFFDKATAKEITAIFRTNINRSAFANFSIGVPMGYLQVKLDTEGAAEWLKKSKRFSQIEETIAHSGVSFDEFTSYFTGDMLFAVKNIRKVRQSVEVFDEKKGRNIFRLIDTEIPDFVAGFVLQNQQGFDKIMDALTQDNALIKEKDGYYSLFRELFLIRKDNAIYFTDNEELAKDLMLIRQTPSILKAEHLHLQNTPIWIHLNRTFFEKIYQYRQQTKQRLQKNKNTKTEDTQPSFIIDDITIRMHQVHESHIRSHINLQLVEKENTIMYIYHLIKQELQKVIKEQQDAQHK